MISWVAWFRTSADPEASRVELLASESTPVPTRQGLSPDWSLDIFGSGQFGDLPDKPTIAAKYAAIVATSRISCLNETHTSLTFPSFVQRNVCFYGQSPLIRFNSRENVQSPGKGCRP